MPVHAPKPPQRKYTDDMASEKNNRSRSSINEEAMKPSKHNPYSPNLSAMRNYNK